MIITEFVSEELPREGEATPGLEHFWLLRQLDRTGLSPWLLGLGSFVTLVIVGVVLLIIVGYPDPDMYRNTIAFTAIISFFVVFYFSMGRGWHQDALKFLRFDASLEPHMDIIRPTSKVLYLEFAVIAACVFFNLQISDQIALDYSALFFVTITLYYAIQWALIIACIDIILRQLICLVRLVRHIRIDLLESDFYSTLANAMVRHIGLYIFGLCIVSTSYIVFTEGTLTAGEMATLLMPWYLPGLFIISLYVVPFNTFRRRMRSKKMQELNSISAVLAGNPAALEHTLLKGETLPGKIHLLYYRDRIAAIREWPFTDRIRALVLFGILPPLTWVIAALIEIMIESSL